MGKKSVVAGTANRGKKSYLPSSVECPFCGLPGTMRKIRRPSGYWWIRYYCVNDKCPVDHIFTQYCGSEECADRWLKKYKRR